ncbi:MAG: alkaline phosphatase family protein [Candidatus Atabeyarchaeum deiterrae]
MLELGAQYDKSLVKEADITPGLFKPNYNRGIHMVLPTALSFLGFNLPEVKYPSLSDVKSIKKTMENNTCFDADKIIMIVTDSVGIEQFQKFRLLPKAHESLGGLQLSSVFPTITSTALASIHLAASPGIHGVFGHKIFFKELGAVVDTLKMSTLSFPFRDALVRVGIDARALTYCDSPYDLVEQQGIRHVELLEDEIAGTGLSNMIYRRQVAHGFSNLIDAFSTAKTLLEEESNKKLIVNLYTGILDSLSHKYGPLSDEYSLGARHLEENMKRLIVSVRDSVAERTTFIFLSDHGQDTIHPDLEITFTKDELDELGRFLRAPIGKSGRVLHFYAKKGFEDQLRRALNNKVENRGYVITFEEAIKNFIGRTPNLEMSRLRLGDFLLVLKKGVNAEIKKSEPPNGWKDQFLGSHGSATLSEMIVPFIAVRLSRLKQCIT